MDAKTKAQLIYELKEKAEALVAKAHAQIDQTELLQSGLSHQDYDQYNTLTRMIDYLEEF